MNDRYSRQIATGKITVMDQKLLAKKKVVVVGAGAIGSPLAILLVRLGVKNITLIDANKIPIEIFNYIHL